MEVIAIREFEQGQEPIDNETGLPARGRVVYRVKYRTGKMKRLESNALVKLEDGEAVVRLGDQQQARAVAAIVDWEGPGLDGLPVTMQTLDELPIDDFIQRVYDNIEEAFKPRSEKEKEKEGANADPKAQRNTQQLTEHGRNESAVIQWDHGRSNTYNVEPGLVGSLIKSID